VPPTNQIATYETKQKLQSHSMDDYTN
jgi:hypothetical protein